MAASGVMYRNMAPVAAVAEGVAPPEAPIKIRKNFPESWICENFDFGALGLVVVVVDSKLHACLTLCFALFVCFDSNFLLFVLSLEDKILAIPYALAIRGDVRRKNVKTAIDSGDGVVIRSSFPESWIFDDFDEYVWLFHGHSG